MKRWSGYEHGVNLGGWLSQCDHTKERYETFIVEEDIAKIKEFGLDHIRVPVDYDLVEEEDGTYKEEGFSYIDRAISWCRKYGLNMVLDLHKTYGYSFDAGEGETGFFENEAYQERFMKLWEEFARRFSRNQDMLAFELLNEVTDKEYCDAWNRISSECIRRIRVIASEISILIGGYYNNSIEALKDLLMPQDEHIIYNFHCYEPIVFTHQGAYWAPGMDTSFRMTLDATYKEMAESTAKYILMGTVGFDGFPEDGTLGPEYFEKYFSEAVQIAEERNVALYCGEYGVINLARPEDTLEWYRFIGEVFDKYGIGRAAWSYKEMDFGLIDDHMKPVLSEILKVL